MRSAPVWLRRLAAGVAAALLLSFAGCGGERRSDAARPCTAEAVSGERVSGCLTARDQQSDGTTVKVDDVDMEGAPGWIVFHTDDAGELGPRLGLTHVPEGRSAHLEVKLANKVPSGTYWVMLHVDAGAREVYEFPVGPDVPVLTPKGMAMERIRLAVP